MKRVFMYVSLIPILIAGCSEPSSFLSSKNPDKTAAASENIKSGLTPEQVVRLYLTLTGRGKYVMAYELLNDKEKRAQTIQTLSEVGKQGRTELDKIISVQQKDNVSLVAAAVNVTDKNSQETKREIKEFVLTKDGEWRLNEQNQLGKDQRQTLTELVTKQSDAIKNSQEAKELINFVEQQNKKLLNSAEDMTKKGIDQIVGSLKSSLESNNASK